ncbi:penicillin-binding protein activator [Qipengyuania oceanensis]|uniref:ABC transporter substrate-binding protein n=1 Tax=Qipengyuania oceanensis TaxID=1463597 RepID=A0A844YF52_9SPHN|nr:penicillin-binding protein activator [Qipengyuania oceanensis]MXO61674.1 ABC transporter substrate-binding protein [Qipengyuania oceanensis]
MKRFRIDRRMLILAGASALMAGCSVIPKGAEPTTGPVTTPTPEPSSTSLPTDETRHRIALLVPLSGSNAAVGQSISNATTMALLDTNADNLRITTYDTASGARAAAKQAVADGNKVILGPLLGNNVGAVLAEARPANVPLISFSNDTSVAGADVFVMGQIPEQSIDRTVRYARSRGSNAFAAIIPDGEYGRRAEASLTASVRAAGGSIAAIERYDRGNTSIMSAAQRLKAKGGYDTVLIPDGARLAATGAAELKAGGAATQLLGTELWSGESSVASSTSLRGALFSAVSDGRYRRFNDSYKSRFGSQPYRISTLGYDAVLLVLNVARDWKVGRVFPVAKLRDSGGFLGLDGPFRFQRSGVVERSMEVRQVRAGEVVVVDGAPAKFSD